VPVAVGYDLSQLTLELRAECIRENIRVDWRGTVSSSDAAKLIGWTPGHLANMRSYGKAPPHIEVNGKPRYRLAEIVKWELQA
jgi:hypothetical protein